MDNHLIGGPPDRRVWRAFALITFGSALYYAVLNNCLWMPRNDASYYIAIARSLARGEGLVFNGHAVTLVPPGWPAVLAGFMRISPGYQFLTWVTTCFMALTVGIWFWILRRFARLPVVIVTLVFTVLLFDWYTAAIQLRSEALFCILLSTALLVSFQISEMKPLHWRLLLLLFLCAAMVAARWAGIVNWILIAATLLNGELWPRLNRRWTAVILTGAVTVATFFGLRHYQAKVFPSQLAERHQQETEHSSTRAEISRPILDLEATTQSTDSGPAVEAKDPQTGSREDVGPPRSRPEAARMEGLLTRASGEPALEPARALEMGLWWASLFWKPTYLAITVPLVSILANLLGWVLIALYAWTTFAEARKRRWILLSALLLSLALVVRWPNLRPMYLMPMAPLLLYGIWRGAEALGQRLGQGRARTTLKRTFWAAAATVVLVNMSLYSVDIWVAHSSDYYSRYFAGRAEGLLKVAHYLREAEAEDGEVGINPKYQNLNRFVPNGFALRNLNLLVDRKIVEVPPKIGNKAPSQEVFAVAREMGIRYYVWRPPVSPWQLWHFHAPTIQRRMTGADEIEVSPTWVLYEITPDGGIEISLSQFNPPPPRKVLGVNDDRRSE